MFATWMTRLWPKWCAMISRGPLALPRKACRHLSFLFFFGDHEFMILKKIIIIIINKKKKGPSVRGRAQNLKVEARFSISKQK